MTTVRELLATLAHVEPSLAAAAVRADARLDAHCSGVTHDSRDVTGGGIFVALPGAHVDGGRFAADASGAGAAAVVVQSPADVPGGTPVFVVPDARAALASLAAAYHRHPSRELRVVGITGTNGKTTTSYLLHAIFEAAGVPCGLVGTVSYRIGGTTLEATHTTPEAPAVHGLLRQMVSAGCGACAMEVSSHALALQRVDGVRFAAAVFTNLTRDHLDFHQNMEEYFAAKRRLFEMLPPDAPAVINLDDPRGASLVEAAGRPVTYAVGRPADVTPGPVSYSLRGLEFDVRTPQGVFGVESALAGRPNVYNILAAAAAAAALGVPLDAIRQGVRSLKGVPGRFELASDANDDITVVVDYAHTDDALRNLLETARALARRRLITVFGAGGDRDRTKRPLMGMVAARLSDVVVITSDNPRREDPVRIIEEVKRGAEPERRQSGAEVLAIVDRREAIFAAIGRAQPGDVVLIAGKGHETYQEVDGRRLPFDDVAVAREALQTRRIRLRAG